MSEAQTFSHVLVLVVMPDGERLRVTVSNQHYAAIQSNPRNVFERDWFGRTSAGHWQTVAARYVVRFWFEDDSTERGTTTQRPEQTSTDRTPARVYVVTHQKHEGASIVGVFRTRADAQNARRSAYPSHAERQHVFVEEFTLDEIDPDA